MTEQDKRLSLDELLEALKYCGQVGRDGNEEKCQGCPIYQGSAACIDIIIPNAFTYLRILADKCREDNEELRRRVEQLGKPETVPTVASFKATGRTEILTPAKLPEQQEPPASFEAQAPWVLPAHWIVADNIVINPDKIQYIAREGPRTKIKMTDGRLLLQGDPLGLARYFGEDKNREIYYGDD